MVREELIKYAISQQGTSEMTAEIMVDSYLSSKGLGVRRPKLCVIGSGRHGKDSFAEIMRDEFGYTFNSSSQAASEIFIYEELKEKYEYKSAEECYEDRINRRAEWYNMICEYNKFDKARLAREIMSKNNMYVGMRDSEEIKECKRIKLFDLVIWIDASNRLPKESKGSFNITKSDADIIIENNGTYQDFKDKVIKLAKTWM